VPAESLAPSTSSTDLKYLCSLADIIICVGLVRTSTSTITGFDAVFCCTHRIAVCSISCFRHFVVLRPCHHLCRDISVNSIFLWPVMVKRSNRSLKKEVRELNCKVVFWRWRTSSLLKSSLRKKEEEDSFGGADWSNTDVSSALRSQCFTLHRLSQLCRCRRLC
jgi:hypothetical protein